MLIPVPACRALVQSKRQGRDWWRRRASRDRFVPHLAMVCSTLESARPCVPQFGVALSARAGFLISVLLEGFGEFPSGDLPILVWSGEAASGSAGVHPDKE